MAKGESNGARGATIETVVFGFTAQLPEELIAKHGVERFNGAKLGAEEVDGAGQRWISVRLPLGGNVQRDRGDTVYAVALIKQSDGYCVAKLELPLSVAGLYVVETTDPESRGFAIDQAQRHIADMADPT